MVADGFFARFIFKPLLFVLADDLEMVIGALDIRIFFSDHVKLLLLLCIDEFRPQLNAAAFVPKPFGELWKFNHMEFYFVRVQEMPRVL